LAGPAARPNNLIGLGILALWGACGTGLAAGYGPGPLTFAFVMLGWILAVVAHELSHAAVAFAAGDHTVAEKGYLSFDPRRYGHLQTTLLIPLIAVAMGGIGFPGGTVHLRNDLMRNRLWRSAAALAGPAANLLLLIWLAMGFSLWRWLPLTQPYYEALAFLALLQAMALILNLLPLPGLDGFGALRPFLPDHWTPALRRIEGGATIVVLLLVFLAPGVSQALFAAASAMVGAFGIPAAAWINGYASFHFWR
jgi:Zn-dependent protease